jgi:3-oxoacyl-[acyl-carrier-protein] synthase-3
MAHSSPHFFPQNLASPPGESALEPVQTAVAPKVQSVNGRSPHVKAATNGSEQAAAKPVAEKLFKLSRRTHSLLGVQIVGTGSYLPETIVSNEDLEEKFGFEKGWIEPRTGILNRRHAAPGEATSQMCSEAARRAIHSASINKNDIDLVVVGTFTPDYHCPSTACLVQDELKLDAPAVDLQAACSGFMYALVTAAQYVATGNSDMALVIGGDTNTRIVDQRDQKTGPLFGDGAGAVLLTRGSMQQGLLCYQMGADGSGGPLLQIPKGGTASPSRPEDLASGDLYLQMEGRTVFKWAVEAVKQTIRLLLEKTDLTVNDVDCYLLHQANIRIIDKAMQDLGITGDRVFNNLQHYGNTSAGSIPIALDEALRAGRFDRGDTLLLSGFGAGLTWGTALFRW